MSVKVKYYPKVGDLLKINHGYPGYGYYNLFYIMDIWKDGIAIVLYTSSAKVQIKRMEVVYPLETEAFVEIFKVKK